MDILVEIKTKIEKDRSTFIKFEKQINPKEEITNTNNQIDKTLHIHSLDNRSEGIDHERTTSGKDLGL